MLGTLTLREVDQPWLQCDFSPSAGYVEVAPFFASELAALNAEPFDSESWERQYSKIDALALSLAPIGQARTIGDTFLLHIDGKNAWFRS